jgi:hypothetical protein
VNERQKTGGGGTVTDSACIIIILIIIIITGKMEKFAALKVPRQCPLVLLVKVGSNKIKAREVKKVAP